MRDTTEKARELQALVQERLGGEGRLRLTYDLSTAARALALAGLRARRPDCTSAQLYRALHQSPGTPPSDPASRTP